MADLYIPALSLFNKGHSLGNTIPRFYPKDSLRSTNYAYMPRQLSPPIHGHNYDPLRYNKNLIELNAYYDAAYRQRPTSSFQTTQRLQPFWHNPAHNFAPRDINYHPSPEKYRAYLDYVPVKDATDAKTYIKNTPYIKPKPQGSFIDMINQSDRKKNVPKPVNPTDESNLNKKNRKPQQPMNKQKFDKAIIELNKQINRLNIQLKDDAPIDFSDIERVRGQYLNKSKKLLSSLKCLQEGRLEQIQAAKIKSKGLVWPSGI